MEFPLNVPVLVGAHPSPDDPDTDPSPHGVGVMAKYTFTPPPRKSIVMRFKTSAPIFWPYQMVNLTLSVFYSISDRLLILTADTDERLQQWLETQGDTCHEGGISSRRTRFARALLTVPDSAPEAKISDDPAHQVSPIVSGVEGGSCPEIPTGVLAYLAEHSGKTHNPIGQTDQPRAGGPDHQADQGFHPQNTGFGKGTQNQTCATFSTPHKGGR